jgi:hypothetical protein
MKLIIGKPDDSELVLAEQVSGAWRPNPNLAAEPKWRRSSKVPTLSNLRCGSKSPNRRRLDRHSRR